MKNLKTYKELNETLFRDPELFYLVSFRNITKIERYIKDGKDLEVKDSSGWTALLRAVFNIQNDSAKALIKGGADVNTLTPDGVSSLMYAANDSNMETVRLLIDAGADWNVVDRGRTFFDILDYNYQDEIKHEYPEKYTFYLNTKKYNI